jgi:hypothetical protein
MRLAFLLFLLAVMLLVAGAARSDSDTITLSRAQLEQLQQEVAAIVRQREAAAFKAGQQDVRERCASLI